VRPARLRDGAVQTQNQFGRCGQGRIERRLAAILAADVAGYSRLMGADEEGTLAQLKGHRRAFVDPKIARRTLLIVLLPIGKVERSLGIIDLMLRKPS
jgi:class 3 adenylate cyclase